MPCTFVFSLMFILFSLPCQYRQFISHISISIFNTFVHSFTHLLFSFPFQTCDAKFRVNKDLQFHGVSHTTHKKNDQRYKNKLMKSIMNIKMKKKKKKNKYKIKLLYLINERKVKKTNCFIFKKNIKVNVLNVYLLYNKESRRKKIQKLYKKNQSIYFKVCCVY